MPGTASVEVRANRRSQQYRSYPAAEQPEVTSKYTKTPQLHFPYTRGEVGQVGQHNYKTRDTDFVNFYIQQVLQKYLSEHYWLVWGNSRKEGKSSIQKTPLRISQQAETSNNFRILKGIGQSFLSMDKPQVLCHNIHGIRVSQCCRDDGEG